VVLDGEDIALSTRKPLTGQESLLRRRKAQMIEMERKRGEDL